jgi:hypothetical protein
MSQAIATPITPHSARITEAAPTRPFLVIETLDHSAGTSMLLTYTYGMEPAPAPTSTTQFTFCAKPGPFEAVGAETTAPVAVGCDAVAGSWI